MFTGIVEALGTVADLRESGTNLHITVNAPFTSELKIDQSVAHNGVCLTVTHLEENSYTATAIKETLEKTNLSSLKIGHAINLERCMITNSRFDGHIVQGHVDQTGTCNKVEDLNGSWKFYFSYDASKGNVTVEKGSICVNGVSLTVVDSGEGNFSIAVIPFTYEHTTFKDLKAGDKANLEFDIIGKYVARLLGNRM